jgi:hypothetical protein
MAVDDIETKDMIILTVCTQYIGESSSSSSDESSEDSDDEALLLKTAVAMIERRAIPKIGSFVDMALSYDNQEFHVLTIDSALRLETNAAFVATNRLTNDTQRSQTLIRKKCTLYIKYYLSVNKR